MVCLTGAEGGFVAFDCAPLKKRGRCEVLHQGADPEGVVLADPGGRGEGWCPCSRRGVPLTYPRVGVKLNHEEKVSRTPQICASSTRFPPF